MEDKEKTKEQLISELEELRQRITEFEEIAVDRNKTEERLIFLQKVIDSASDAIGMATPEGRHYYQNRSFDKLFGLSIEETDGKTGPPSTVYIDEEVGRMLFETIMSGDTWVGEVEMYDANRNILNIFLQAYPIKDENHKVISLVRVHTNITERKQAEKALIKTTVSKAYADNILKSMTDSLIVINPDATIKTLNQSTLNLLGYEEEELIGKPVETIIDEEQGYFSGTGIDKLFKNDFIQGAERTYLAKDGRRIPVLFSSSAMRNEKGRIHGNVYVAQDITKHKNAEEELSRIFDLSLDMICIADVTTGYFKRINPAFVKILGYSKEELLGKPFIDFVHTNDIDSTTKVTEDQLATGKEIIGFENRYRCKDGSFKWLMWTASSIREQGITYAIARDITERKKMEEELRKAEGRFFDVAISMSDWIWEVDAQARFTYVSGSVEEILGYKEEELLGKTPFDLMPPDEAERVDRIFTEIYANMRPIVDLENRALTKDGHEVCFLTNGVPMLDNEGKLFGYRGVDKDITERKQSEKALLQSEKLKSIGTITAGISHEFNNLLAIISGNVQLLEEDYIDDKVLTDSLHIIKKAADDGAEIASNMLKFTRTKPDTKEFISSDIREMIMQSIDFTKPRWKNEAQAKGIVYKIDTEGVKIVPPIMCKRSEIREIFINVTNNALEAMPSGGSISFSTWSCDDTVFVCVTDTGMGIPDAVKKNIFDPFFSTKGVEGTGLGMSMVYGIVIRHGGNINVTSEVGRGTTFTLQFPATNESRSLMEMPDTKQETNTKCLRILVVDDEEDIRNILNRHLSRRGHNVKTVDNGADAINMIEIEGFDLVLCDLAMPNVFGYDVVEALYGLKKIPKIGIITGWNEERVSDNEMKVDFYLKKPFKLLELTKHMDKLFSVDSKY